MTKPTDPSIVMPHQRRCCTQISLHHTGVDSSKFFICHGILFSRGKSLVRAKHSGANETNSGDASRYEYLIDAPPPLRSLPILFFLS